MLREFEFDKRRASGNWIRNVHFFDEMKTQYLIICCTDAQAQEFQNVQMIEMDLSFKMVQGKTNVFSISAWNTTIRRISHLSILSFNVWYH